VRHAERLANVFINPDQYPMLTQDARLYREKYPHWQSFLITQVAFYKKYSSQIFAVAKAQSSYIQRYENQEWHRICFDPYFAISLEHPFTLQAAIQGSTESQLEVMSPHLQKRCIPVHHAQRIVKYCLAQNGRHIQQFHQDVFDWLNALEYAEIPDALVALDIYPAPVVVSASVVTTPPVVAPAVAVKSSSIGESFLHDLVAATSDMPNHFHVQKQCPLYRHDTKIGMTDYMVQIEDVRTYTLYWLIVIEVNVLTPYGLTQICTTMCQYREATTFVSATQPANTAVDTMHDIIIVMDIHGVCILRNGEFINGCTFQQPLWRRKAFATLDMRDIVAILCSFIVPTVPSPMPISFSVPPQIADIQPAVIAPSIPISPPPPSALTTVNTPSGCVISALYCRDLRIVDHGERLQWHICGVCVATRCDILVYASHVITPPHRQNTLNYVLP
jgi:hypothetical protein